MNMNIKYILPLVSSFIISGCDSDGISKVKSSIDYSIDDSMTIGKAFDTRSDCINGTWSEEEDSRGRTVVTYTCDISETGMKIINSEIIKGPESSLTGSIKNNNMEIDNINKSIEMYKQQASLIEQTRKLMIEHVRKLENAFNEDPKISNNINIEPYLNKMLNIECHQRNEGYSCTTDEECRPYMNGLFSPNVSYDYLEESCQKHILPVYQSYIKNVLPLKSKIKAISFTGMFNYCGRSSEECIKLIDDKFNGFSSYNQKQTQKISFYEDLNTRKNKTLNECKKILNISDVKLKYYWRVTDTGGVDYLSGELTYRINGENKSVAYNNNLVKYAYVNYTEKQIPSNYVNSILNQNYETIKNCSY